MGFHWKLVLFSLFQCLIGFGSLYHLASLNALHPFVTQLINDSLSANHTQPVSESDVTWIWSVVTTVGLVGCAVGGLLIEPVAEQFGRRLSLGVLKNIVLVVGSVMQMLSKTFCSWQLLLVGRFVACLSCPLSGYACVYVAECSPNDVRGIVSASTAVGYRLWTMLGMVFSLPVLLGTESLWPVALIVPAVPAVAQILLTPFHPESPKYLYITKNQVQKAREAIMFFHGPTADVDGVLEEYEAEKALRAERTFGCSSSLWEKRHLRWPFLICILVLSSTAITDIADQYSVEILMDAGVSQEQSALYTVLAVQLPTLLLMVVGAILLFCLGRRTLFLIGFGVSIFGSFLMAMSAFEAFDYSAILVAGMALILVGDSLGPNLVRFFLPAELCPQSIRSLSSAWGMCVANVLGTFIILFFPPLLDTIGFSCVWILTGTALPAFIFLYATLPETKNKTVNQALAKWISESCENIPLLDT